MILKFLRYFAVSFSLFSRIPMPRFVWKEEDMSYAFVFFPLVGALIGGLILLLNLPERMSDISLAVRVLLISTDTWIRRMRCDPMLPRNEDRRS